MAILRDPLTGQLGAILRGVSGVGQTAADQSGAAGCPRTVHRLHYSLHFRQRPQAAASGIPRLKSMSSPGPTVRSARSPAT